MQSHGKTLVDLARGASGLTAPQTIDEAEAMLLQMAGPSFDTRTSQIKAQDADRKPGPLTLRRPSATRIQNSIAAMQKYSEAFECVADAIVIVDRDGIILLGNSQLENLFGYPRAELLGQPIELLIPERFRESHIKQRESFFAEPHIRQMGTGMDLRGRHELGHEFPVEIRLCPINNDADPVVVATIRDTSESLRIAAERRRFETRYRTLVEGLPAVTFMAALDGGMNELYVSPQIETLLGFSQEEWLGNPILWYTQLHQDDRSRWHMEFAVTCATGHKFNSIYRFYSRSGRIVWVHGEAKVIRDEFGQPLFLQGVAFDITQLKEAEDQLRQLNQTLEARVQERTSELQRTNESLELEVRERQRAEDDVRRINEDLARAHEEAIAANTIKSQFLANMSHELRTPLNAIIGYSELLQLLTARKKDDSYSADLERIKKAGLHLLVLINDILDISKIEAGKLQLEMEVNRVESLIEDIHETALPLVTPNNNTLHVHVGENLGMIHADMTRLKQCLLNLVSNACKFTKDGRVVFSVAQESMESRDWIAFRIQDTGIGLTEEQANRLFQPFTQADSSTTRKFGGTGLGLAITKKLCEAMGGRINLESKLGEGSTFTIRMPIYTAAE